MSEQKPELVVGKIEFGDRKSTAELLKEFSPGRHLPPRVVELAPEPRPVDGPSLEEVSAEIAAEIEAGREHETRIAEAIAASTLKDTNPKDAIGSDKLPYHLWPNTATVYGTLGMLDGALKYGRSNFRASGVRWTIYYDAAQRHMDKLKAGEDIDTDSGLPHECHILACWAIIVDAKTSGKLIDDRDYPSGYLTVLKWATAQVKRLRLFHKDKNPHHYTIADVREVSETKE